MKEQRRFNVILKIMAVIISLSIVIGCASTESVQAATKKSSGSTYYVTLLNHQNGGRSANGRYWMPGTLHLPLIQNPLQMQCLFCSCGSRSKVLPAHRHGR